MIKIIIEDIKGEYKYKKVSILKNDEIVDRFRIDHRLATEEQLRAHPLYGVRVSYWKEEDREPYGKMPKGYDYFRDSHYGRCSECNKPLGIRSFAGMNNTTGEMYYRICKECRDKIEKGNASANFTDRSGDKKIILVLKEKETNHETKS